MVFLNLPCPIQIGRLYRPSSSSFTKLTFFTICLQTKLAGDRPRLCQQPLAAQCLHIRPQGIQGELVSTIIVCFCCCFKIQLAFVYNVRYRWALWFKMTNISAFFLLSFMILLLSMILHDTPPFPSLILYDTPHHSLPPPSSSITNFSITQTIHVLHKLAALFVVKEGESVHRKG